MTLFKIMRKILPFCCLPLLLALGACATLEPNREQPKIDLVGITKSETDTAALQFTLQIRIVNPNARPIELDGIFYELSLDELEVLSGTASNLPTIEGFSDAIVSVRSTAGLVNSMRLASRLLESDSGVLPYELRIKLGSKSRWLTPTTITKSGSLPLR